MHIHEYQAKKILQELTIKTPKSVLITNTSEVEYACKTLGGDIWVAKAQVLTGSRGKGGGVVVCKDIKEVQQTCDKLLGTNLITPQTDDKGLPVNSILIEQGMLIESELYLSILIDRSLQQINIIASKEGGGDIEELALNHPDKIITLPVDITEEISQQDCDYIAEKLAVDKKQFSYILLNLYTLFISKDCQLIEINPLIISQGELIALDCKIEFDDNASYKHPEIFKLRDVTQENPKELEAAKYGLNYITLDGNIGCMVNGAGLAMATMDLIKYHGGKPLNFLDVGGGTTSEKVVKAFEIIQSETGVKAILVNIFGGIVRCDLIASGIIQAIDKIGLKIPLVVRLEGTNAQIGLDILSQSKYNIISENDLTLAAKKVVEASK